MVAIAWLLRSGLVTCAFTVNILLVSFWSLAKLFRLLRWSLPLLLSSLVIGDTLDLSRAQTHTLIARTTYTINHYGALFSQGFSIVQWG
jgi:hypothetical protein